MNDYAMSLVLAHHIGTPDFPLQLDAIACARAILIDAQKSPLVNERRVKFLNTLREVVSRNKPTNKAGRPIVSDYDLVDANALQQAEALVKMLGEWAS